MSQPKRIVLTGGPGAGKTVISCILAQRHAERLVLVPEAATQVYAQLGTRWDRLDLAGRRDVQRRIYWLQLEQEERIAARHPGQALLLDRGTVDGAAYWPEGPADYWRDLGTTLEQELRRYAAVIWLQSAAAIGLYDGSDSNACRFEDADSAIACGNLVRQLWEGHGKLREVRAYQSLEEKVAEVEGLIRLEAAGAEAQRG